MDDYWSAWSRVVYSGLSAAHVHTDVHDLVFKVLLLVRLTVLNDTILPLNQFAVPFRLALIVSQ